MCADAVRFGPFELDVRRFELRRRGRVIPLDRKAFGVLRLLVERSDQLVTHEEAVRAVWGAEVVIEADAALYTAIRKVRRALGDPARKPKWIETVARKGYRFRHAAAAPGPGRRSRPGAPESRTLLAVLPLVDHGASPDSRYFVDGLTEQLTAEIARSSPALGVIARTTMQRLAAGRHTAAEIGRKLAVDYLLEGGVRRESDRVRITLRLIRAADEVAVWSDGFERRLSGILDLQSRIAAAVAEKLRERLEGPSRPRAKVDPDLYDRNLRARFLAGQRDAASVSRAIRAFEEILAIDERFAPAWAGLALCLARGPITSDARPTPTFARARLAVERALALDAELAEAHLAKGIIDFWHAWDWSGAEAAFGEAQRLDPSDSEAVMFAAHLRSNLGRHEDALALIARARRLDPLSPIVGTHAGQFLYNARRYDDALPALARVIEFAPRFWVAHIVLGKALGMRRRHTAAARAFASAGRHSGGNTEALALRAYTLADAGDRAGARRLIRRLDARALERYVPPLHHAFAWLGLGERRAALEMLVRALEERDVRLTFLSVEPRWDALRAEPSFMKIAKAVGLPTAMARRSVGR